MLSRLPNDPSARRLTRNYGALSALQRTLEQVRDEVRADRTTIFGTTLLRSPSWAEAPGVCEYAGEQITQAKNHLNQSMTMEQLLEAEQRAAEWIRKMRKIPPSSIDNPPNASTA